MPVVRALVLLVALHGPQSSGTAQSAPAQAAPRIAETVVVTATAAPVPETSLGRVVATVTGDDLARLGIAHVADALRLVAGVDVRARGPHDVQTDFSVRGATFGQQLVLVDGLRLNDSQSGHHNGDIPTPLVAIDRIEVVPGGGSGVHGADALGGTINVLTRRDPHAILRATVGQHGLVTGQASLSGRWVPASWTVAGWGSRSSGFTFDRDFALGGVSARGRAGRGWLLDLRHQRKAFGANGFYGPSPSKEWTDQTLGAVVWRRSAGSWYGEATVAWRNHGDHFRWDINRPGFAENRHRTNAVSVEAKAHRDLGAGVRLAAGTGGGSDWVRSTNLGDHDYQRAHAFVELQTPVGTRGAVAGSVRFDGYSTFGRSWSPALSAGVWITPAVRVRASAARAFRVPTFTELYYRDPSNLGRSDLAAERGWSLDGGLDWTSGGWTIGATPFVRWDENVIDWVRPTPADVWRSTNVRDVTSRGLETAATRRWLETFVRGHYTYLEVSAPALSLLSKYVLEYPTHVIGVSLAGPLPGRLRTGLTVDHRRRLDGQVYTLVGARIARPVGRAEISVEGTNLLNERYHEVAGVAMPGRWLAAGVLVR